MRLLVTRPEPDNERTAAALRAAGHEAVAGLTVRTVVVYRVATTDRLPAAAQSRIDGVLHFSRRSVETYLACGGAVSGPAHYCLSERAAEPLKAAGARILVAAR